VKGVRCLLGGLVERRQVRQVLKRVCLVLRERVRLEVGVVVGLEGTFGRGRTCGSSVSAAVTDDSGRGGFGVLLVLVCCQFIFFRKRLFIIIVTNFYFKERNQFFPYYLVE
jgi:hypothetical protein